MLEAANEEQTLILESSLNKAIFLFLSKAAMIMAFALSIHTLRRSTSILITQFSNHF